jgi:hypothetical protein
MAAPAAPQSAVSGQPLWWQSAQVSPPRKRVPIGVSHRQYPTIGIMTTALAYDNSVRIGCARVATRAQGH